jgi:hypothetical protein
MVPGYGIQQQRQERDIRGVITRRPVPNSSSSSVQETKRTTTQQIKRSSTNQPPQSGQPLRRPMVVPSISSIPSGSLERLAQPTTFIGRDPVAPITARGGALRAVSGMSSGISVPQGRPGMRRPVPIKTSALPGPTFNKRQTALTGNSLQVPSDFGNQVHSVLNDQNNPSDPNDLSDLSDPSDLLDDVSVDVEFEYGDDNVEELYTDDVNDAIPIAIGTSFDTPEYLIDGTDGLEIDTGSPWSEHSDTDIDPNLLSGVQANVEENGINEEVDEEEDEEEEEEDEESVDITSLSQGGLPQISRFTRTDRHLHTLETKRSAPVPVPLPLPSKKLTSVPQIVRQPQQQRYYIRQVRQQQQQQRPQFGISRLPQTTSTARRLPVASQIFTDIPTSLSTSAGRLTKFSSAAPTASVSRTIPGNRITRVEVKDCTDEGCIAQTTYADGSIVIGSAQSVRPDELDAVLIRPKPDNGVVPRIVLPSAPQSHILRAAHTNDYNDNPRDIAMRTLQMRPRTGKGLWTMATANAGIPPTTIEYIEAQRQKDVDGWSAKEAGIMTQVLSRIQKWFEASKWCLPLPQSVSIVKSKTLAGEFAGWDGTHEEQNVLNAYNCDVYQRDSAGKHGIMVLGWERITNRYVDKRDLSASLSSSDLTAKERSSLKMLKPEIIPYSDEDVLNRLFITIMTQLFRMSMIEQPDIFEKCLKVFVIWNILPSQDRINYQKDQQRKASIFVDPSSSSSGTGAGTGAGTGTTKYGRGDQEDRQVPMFPQIPIIYNDRGIASRLTYQIEKPPVECFLSLTSPTTTDQPTPITKEYLLVSLATQPSMAILGPTGTTSAANKTYQKNLARDRLNAIDMFNRFHSHSWQGYSNDASSGGSDPTTSSSGNTSGLDDLPFQRIPIELSRSIRPRRDGSQIVMESDADQFANYYVVPRLYLVEMQRKIDPQTGGQVIVIPDGAELEVLSTQNPRLSKVRYDPMEFLNYVFHTLITNPYLDPLNYDLESGLASPSSAWVKLAKEMSDTLRSEFELRMY